MSKPGSVNVQVVDEKSVPLRTQLRGLAAEIRDEVEALGLPPRPTPECPRCAWEGNG